MLRIVNCADWHLRRKNPIMRIDDFYSTIKYKVRWVVQQSNVIQAKAISISGDMFDTTHTSFEVMVDIHRILSRFRGDLLTIYGQHDLRFHSYKARKNTPLSALLATLKNQNPVCERPVVLQENDINVYVFGVSWGQDLLPAPDVPGYKMLLLHRLVVEDGALWPGNTDFILAEDLFKLGYDLVVSGDNHQSFAIEQNNKWVVNVGSLVRLKTTQVDYTPRIAISSFSDKLEIEWKEVPIQKDVFATENQLEALGVSDELVEFITSLQEHRFQKPDFERNLEGALLHINDPLIKAMSDEVMERIIQQEQQGGFS